MSGVRVLAATQRGVRRTSDEKRDAGTLAARTSQVGDSHSRIPRRPNRRMHAVKRRFGQ